MRWNCAILWVESWWYCSEPVQAQCLLLDVDGSHREEELRWALWRWMFGTSDSLFCSFSIGSMCVFGMGVCVWAVYTWRDIRGPHCGIVAWAPSTLCDSSCERPATMWAAYIADSSCSDGGTVCFIRKLNTMRCELMKTPPRCETHVCIEGG